MPNVCMIMLTYGDRFSLLQETINAAFQCGVNEVILVDNGTTGETQISIKKLINNYENKIQYIRFNENAGSAAGYSIGIAKACHSTNIDFI